MAAPKPCACGCGRVVKGQRRSCQFYSTTCRVRFYRQKSASVATVATRTAKGSGAVCMDGHVTLTTESREVHCRACGRELTALDGPLPCPAYCRDCAAVGACGCAPAASLMSEL
jgi:hypothetical protein